MTSSAGRSAAAIAGLGAVTGYGWGFPSLRTGVADGRSAARAQAVDGLDVLAATVPPPDGSLGDEVLTDEVLTDLSRYEQAALFAVAEALDDARARGWRSGPTVGVVFCTGIGDIRTMRDSYFRDARPLPSTFPHMLHTSPGSLLSQRYGWTGPNLVLNAACSSGNAAIHLAAGWLASGVASDVVVAGAEFCVIAEIVNGFRRMRVLVGDGAPASDCRPFQDGSRRFFLGEAAAAVVMSREVAAPRAGYLGGATTHDAFHLVAPAPDGAQLERCYREALADAGVEPGDVGLVKAHGSGTPHNDQVEAGLVDRVFPASTRLCSYKPLVGHCMALASLAELAGVLAGYEVGALPRHVTGDPSHPRLADGDPPPEGLVLCGSVGLGGANTAAVFDIPRGAVP
jgi:3-oxoacyl-[acyl-carrier-protein] synthase II